MEKIIVCDADDAEKKINPELRDGWKVKSMVAENVSISVSMTSTSRDWIQKQRDGAFIFVLEK